MKAWIASGMAMALWLGGNTLPARAQVVERERDVSITGPRGRTINRQITTERGPGFIDRQVQVQRPGGTFSSNTFAHRAPGGFRPGFGPGPVYRGWGPGWGWGPRTVVVNNGPGILPALAVGGGLFGLGMLAGSSLAAPPPPPPVVVQPAPYVVVPPAVVAQGAPATVVQPQPVPVQTTGVPAATVMADPGADALTRLKSLHEHSRRDGALTLGQLKDPRAVPELTRLVQHDLSKDVRMASAWALAEIGDPRAAVPLQRAAMFDRRKEVRDAAAEAYRRLPQVTTAAAAPAPGAPLAPAANPPAEALTATSAPFGSTPATATRRDDTPPPPPTPAQPPFGARTSSTTPGFPD